MTPDEFCAVALAGWPPDVSRETLARLGRYEALLKKWQTKINLVGPATLGDIWGRHFMDSAQLFPLVPDRARVLADLGSGAGFPGLVLAILADGAGRNLAVHLVESDARKAAFLIEAAREAGVGGRVQVHTGRAENLKGRIAPADVVTARALAPLDRLLVLAYPFLGQDGLCLFLKGAKAEDEIAAAAAGWTFEVVRRRSRTERDGAILEIRTLKPRA